MKSEELTTLTGSLVTLGIVFGSDRRIGYPLMGAGVLLSIASAIRERKKKGRTTTSGGRSHED